MILVDRSVWIDYFNGVASRQADPLDDLLGREPLLTGDIILAEVLGITVRKTIDAFIATFCIANSHSLLHADRGFDPFARHFGLVVV